MSLALTRDVSTLELEEFDLLVIGGGINGVAAAWDASSRGLRVALIEREDFGSKTSAGCFKIIHGGLRYLQHFDLARLFDSVREQRTVRQLAPHLLRPLPFLIPCYKPLMKRRATLRAALTVYELLAFNRNSGVQEELALPNHRVLSVAECLAIAPGLQTEGLEGGVQYFDVQMTNADRLTLAVLEAAVAAGTRAANYVEAIDVVAEASAQARRVTAVTVRDAVSGREFPIRCKTVINATGPWLQVPWNSRREARPRSGVFSKGIQVVLPSLTKNSAVAVEGSHHDPAAKISRGGRAYFIQPWNGYSLVGTSDELFTGDPDSFEISTPDIQRFLAEVRQCYSSEVLRLENVLHAFGGLRPVADDIVLQADGDDAKAARKDLIIDHAHEPFQGQLFENVISMRGVKYTTFRSFAEKAVTVVAQRLGRAEQSTTTALLVPSAPNIPIGEYRRMLEQEYPDIESTYLSYLISNYGCASETIAELVRSGHSRQLVATQPVREAELVYSASKEMVTSLADIVLRRVPLGAFGMPATAVLLDCARLLAPILNWSPATIEEEISGLVGKCRLSC